MADKAGEDGDDGMMIMVMVGMMKTRMAEMRKKLIIRTMMRTTRWMMMGCNGEG